MNKKLKNYINGRWVDTQGTEWLDVVNPATGEVLSMVPAGAAADVADAAGIAAEAAKSWRNVPATQRIQYLFRMKQIMEKNSEEIAAICTSECGKTLAESKAEITRAIENIEVACGIPALLQGAFSEDISNGIDEFTIRQPVGVGACISPFNFPVMIPFWFMPYALACGNTYIVKPSEKVPGTMARIFELFEEISLPAGVLNMVHGAKPAVDELLKNPSVSAISFVGSSAVAKYIYSEGSANGKRVQAQGGAKNPVVVMPDADVASAVKIVADSAFGCAGQRCLAASIVITVGEAYQSFVDGITAAALAKKTGNGLDPATDMGPVISPASLDRIRALLSAAEKGGASMLLDGRAVKVEGHDKGNYIAPTIIGNVDPESEIYNTEVFGPVLTIMHVNTLDEAISLVNRGRYGNSACIFTKSGSAARKFRRDAIAGNIGINIGIAAPMAFFPFSGWKESFFGDLHGQSGHAVEFYTQTKVVIERWHDEWSRKF